VSGTVGLAEPYIGHSSGGATQRRPIGSGQYVAGEVVAISALGLVPGESFVPVPDSHQVFQSWVISAGKATISDTNKAITTLTMPAGPVSITATFLQKQHGNKPAAGRH